MSFVSEWLYCNRFDSFGVEHIPKEIRKLIGNKNIPTNIYRMQAYDSIVKIGDHKNWKHI